MANVELLILPKLTVKQARGTEMNIFAPRQRVNFYRNQDTPVYMCFLDAKTHMIELIIGH